MLRKTSLVLALALLSMCSSACLLDPADERGRPDARDRRDTPEPAPPDASIVVRACSDIDASGLARATSAEHAARWDGVACVAPLDGGQHGGSFFECGYGGDPGVCGRSSGLQLFGCRCMDGRLDCQDGVAIAAHEEAVACPRDAGAR